MVDYYIRNTGKRQEEDAMKFAIYTLGCKVNQYETQAMETELMKRGHELVGFDEAADAYLINTCTVTAISDRKSRTAIRQAQKRCPEAVVAVCGCYAQTAPEAVKELEVDLVSGTGDHVAFLDKVEQLLREREEETADLTDDVMRRRQFEFLPAGGLEGRTRAMLKVEDGCVNFCSYCIIPYARGPIRSMPISDAVTEAKRLAEEGYKEIVITGIEISSWGRDLKTGEGPAELIEAVCRAVPGLRVRLGSLEPRTITQEFCEKVCVLPNLCAHFHLSLQSGCNATLKRMNRKYDTARYRESVELLRKYFDDPGITTDLIVGFPGEDEAEFEQTLEFIREMGFSAMHIFPYSRRSGTPAAKMPGQVPKTVKSERARRAGEAAEEMKRAYLCRHVGRRADVLFEELRQGRWFGHAPNYLEVLLESGEDLHNRVKTVRFTGVAGESMAGSCE